MWKALVMGMVAGMDMDTVMGMDVDMDVDTTTGGVTTTVTTMVTGVGILTIISALRIIITSTLYGIGRTSRTNTITLRHVIHGIIIVILVGNMLAISME